MTDDRDDAALHARLREIDARLDARRHAFGSDAFTGRIQSMSPPLALLDEQTAIIAELRRRRVARRSA